jgi:hypothetical protein
LDPWPTSNAGKNVLRRATDKPRTPPNAVKNATANQASAATALLVMTITRVTMAAIPQRDAIARPHQYPDVNSEWKNPVALSFMPVIPMSFVKDDQLLNYFSMVTTVGTPQTVAAQELRIECMFPADETTETRHNELMRAALA